MRTGRPRVTDYHGTLTGYTNRGCRCDPCTTAQRRYVTMYRLRAKSDHDGRPRLPVLVDAAPVVAHVAALLASGHTRSGIADECGVSRSAVIRIAAGHRTTIKRTTAARILAVEPIPAPADVVDEVAVERVLAGHAPLDSLTRAERSAARVEAARRGWTASEIERRLATSGKRARQLVEEAS